MDFRFFNFFSILVIFALTFRAEAGLFQITQRSYGSVPANYQSAVDAAFNQLETQVNSQLPAANASTYLRGVANATALAETGLGVDYATQFKAFEFGYILGVGADLGGQNFSLNMDANRVGGFSAAQSFVIGIPFGIFGIGKKGFWDFQQFKLYLNYSSQKYNQSNFQSSFTSLGIIGQYKIIDARSWGYKALEWGGVDISMGVLNTKLSAISTSTVSESLPPTTVDLGVPTQITGSFSGAMDVGYEANITKFPIEVSSSFRFLYLFNLYGGLGLDFVSGSSRSITSYSGPVTLTTNPSVGTLSGVASLDLGQESSPSTTMFRYFLGTQLELGVVSFFLQMNKSISPDLVGFNLGARVFW